MPIEKEVLLKPYNFLFNRCGLMKNVLRLRYISKIALIFAVFLDLVQGIVSTGRTINKRNVSNDGERYIQVILNLPEVI